MAVERFTSIPLDECARALEGSLNTKILNNILSPFSHDLAQNTCIVRPRYVVQNSEMGSYTVTRDALSVDRRSRKQKLTVKLGPHEQIFYGKAGLL